ncbi:MAG TPA: fluoride efflux transporter CrcB [Dermatophilaceae bacterium]
MTNSPYLKPLRGCALRARPGRKVVPVPDQHPTEDIDSAAREPIDSDVDLHQGLGRRGRGDATVLAAIAAGGAVGASVRYLIGQTWPTPAGAFPVSTLAINVLGCALIGVLMVLITDVWSRQRLLRPFLGTGVLGGFTTFSTYTVDIQRLVAGAHAGMGLLYLAVTPIGALLAVWTTATTTRRLVNWRIE